MKTSSSCSSLNDEGGSGSPRLPPSRYSFSSDPPSPQTNFSRPMSLGVPTLAVSSSTLSHIFVENTAEIRSFQAESSKHRELTDENTRLFDEDQKSRQETFSSRSEFSRLST